MRTKESADFEQQESTWIYLLHQQAPPQTRLSAEAALTLPPLASASPALGGSALLADHTGPYTGASSRGYDAHDAMDAATRASSHYALAPRAGDAGAALLSKRLGLPAPHAQSSSMLLSAQDKRWSAAPPPPPPPRPMLEPAERFEPRNQSQSHYYPAAELAGARAALENYQTRQQQHTAAGGLLDLLPSKRARLEKLPSLRGFSRLEQQRTEHTATPARATARATATTTAAVTATPTSAPSPGASHEPSGGGKRNCFPKKCDFPLCKNSSRSRGFCYSHGGGRRCRMDGCSNGAVSRDLCKRHGGGRRCRVAGCKSSSESGGLCYSHGGGRRCSLSWCSARAKKGGFCALHVADKGDAPRPAAPQPTTTTPPASSTSAKPQPKPEPKPELEPEPKTHGSAAHTNVVETLLSLAKDAPRSADDATDASSSSSCSPSASSSASASSGGASSGSAYALASILN